jgi:hypothetical protein
MTSRSTPVHQAIVTPADMSPPAILAEVGHEPIGLEPTRRIDRARSVMAKVQRDELGNGLLDLDDRVALDGAGEAVVPPRDVTDLELGRRLGRAGAEPLQWISGPVVPAIAFGIAQPSDTMKVGRMPPSWMLTQAVTLPFDQTCMPVRL